MKFENVVEIQSKCSHRTSLITTKTEDVPLLAQLYIFGNSMLSRTHVKF